jgi:hypothetical protein
MGGNKRKKNNQKSTTPEEKTGKETTAELQPRAPRNRPQTPAQESPKAPHTQKPTQKETGASGIERSWVANPRESLESNGQGLARSKASSRSKGSLGPGFQLVEVSRPTSMGKGRDRAGASGRGTGG